MRNICSILRVASAAMCLMLSGFTALANDSISFDVKGKVPAIKQPKTMDCWAASATMLKGWKDSASYEIADVLDKVDPQYKQMFNGNTGLPIGQAEPFLKAMGLKQEPLANYTVDGLLRL